MTAGCAFMYIFVFCKQSPIQPITGGRAAKFKFIKAGWESVYIIVLFIKKQNKTKKKHKLN